MTRRPPIRCTLAPWPSTRRTRCIGTGRGKAKRSPLSWCWSAWDRSKRPRWTRTDSLERRLPRVKALGSSPDEHASPRFTVGRVHWIPQHEQLAGELVGPNVMCADLARTEAGPNVMRHRVRALVDFPRAEVGVVSAVRVPNVTRRGAWQQGTPVAAPHGTGNRGRVPHNLQCHVTIGAV